MKILEASLLSSKPVNETSCTCQEKATWFMLCGGVLKIRTAFVCLLPFWQPKSFCRLQLTSARGNHAYFFSYAGMVGTFFSYLYRYYTLFKTRAQI